MGGGGDGWHAHLAESLGLLDGLGALMRLERVRECVVPGERFIRVLGSSVVHLCLLLGGAELGVGVRGERFVREAVAVRRIASRRPPGRGLLSEGSGLQQVSVALLGIPGDVHGGLVVEEVGENAASIHKHRTHHCEREGDAR